MKPALLLSFILFSAFSYAQSSCLGDLCVGKKAIDSYDRVGVVSRIEGSRVFYRLSSGSELDSSPGSLSVEIDSPRFASHARVTDGYDRQGRVETAFKDGRVNYALPSGSFLVSRNVSPEVPSQGNVHESVNIVDSYDRVGQVSAVYENGRVAYKLNSGSELISTNVSPAIEETNGVHARDLVVDSYDRTGTAIQVFENGKIQYRLASGSELISTNITPAIERREDGTVSGVKVLDSYDRLGTAQNVYRDGRVQYELPSGSSLISRNVSPEVEGHPQFQKHVVYASNSDIGEVVRFFGNGKIELKGDHDSFCNNLYEEVANLDGITHDSEVVTPDGEGKVERIFSNRLARIALGDKHKNANILKASDLDDAYTCRVWLQVVLFKLINTDGMSSMSTNSAVEKKDYRKLLDLMKSDVNARNSIFQGENKTKLNTYLDAELARIQNR